MMLCIRHVICHSKLFSSEGFNFRSRILIRTFIYLWKFFLEFCIDSLSSFLGIFESKSESSNQIIGFGIETLLMFTCNYTVLVFPTDFPVEHVSSQTIIVSEVVTCTWGFKLVIFFELSNGNVSTTHNPCLHQISQFNVLGPISGVEVVIVALKSFHFIIIHYSSIQLHLNEKSFFFISPSGNDLMMQFAKCSCYTIFWVYLPFE